MQNTNVKSISKIPSEILFTNVFEIQNTKIHLSWILYFTKYCTKYKMSQWQRICFKTTLNDMVQTLSLLMFNKFKQIVLTQKQVSQMIHLTVHFDEESSSILQH